MESSYMDRSDYFKMIAHQHKKIAHERPVTEGSEKLRKSFHRVNDEDELNAACVNWGHFPCVVHVEHMINFRENGTGMPRRVVTNGLMFLDKIDTSPSKAITNQIELAYGYAEEAMNIFLQFMYNDHLENGSCGNLFLFDANNMNALMTGPIIDKLYGWVLTFNDETQAKSLKYDANNFYND